MKLFKKTFVSPETSILETLRVIDEFALEIALVVDKNSRLLGTVTDGDIRRAILRNISLSEPIRTIMNSNPVTSAPDVSEDEILFLMSHKSIKHIPILDSEGRILDLVLMRDLAVRRRRDNWAIVMAGGLGKRLGDLTRQTPKPLLPVGKRPLLGTIVNQLRKHGISKIFVSVNYQADKVKHYLQDGKDFDVEVRYLEEKEFLGTAGPISLLPERPSKPFLIINGDILTSVNFANLLDYHETSGKAMTACIREFCVDIPYGIVKMRGTELLSIKEKPIYKFFINTGIYVLSPSVLDLLSPGEKADMPQIMQRLTEKGSGVGCFPLSEFWLDIGKIEDYQRAQTEFSQLFSDEE